ncbi:hypothetical protein F8M41_020262 [Gigaspora margarita]|uniref:Uncharacterized protein n=1 Tax=Gigaspora margarita TaxID=4874 RepID=A0A8H4B1W0_GIGMA|nr:hypothetical protein F8M41_020262 [Gigaspora margarita]
MLMTSELSRPFDDKPFDERFETGCALDSLIELSIVLLNCIDSSLQKWICFVRVCKFGAPLISGRLVGTLSQHL